MLINSINRDLDSDIYGDIIFTAGDIKTTSDSVKIAKNNSSHRIMSCYSDMYKYRTYGANLQSFIGRPITDTLIKTMEESIRKSLVEDLFLSDHNISIISVNAINKVYFKITIGHGYKFGGNRDSEINIEFDNINGVRYV